MKHLDKPGVWEPGLPTIQCKSINSTAPWRTRTGQWAWAAIPNGVQQFDQRSIVSWPHRRCWCQRRRTFDPFPPMGT